MEGPSDNHDDVPRQLLENAVAAAATRALAASSSSARGHQIQPGGFPYGHHNFYQYYYGYDSPFPPEDKFIGIIPWAMRILRILTLGFMLLCSSIVMYGLFYWAVMPGNCVARPLFFDYTGTVTYPHMDAIFEPYSSTVAMELQKDNNKPWWKKWRKEKGTEIALATSVDSSDSDGKTFSFTPWATVDLFSKEQAVTVGETMNAELVPPQTIRDRVLQPQQRYFVEVQLTLPESELNRNLGMFGVAVELLSYSSQNETSSFLASSVRPGRLPHESSLVSITRKLVWLLPLIFGGMEESRVVIIPAFRHIVESLDHPLRHVVVRLVGQPPSGWDAQTQREERLKFPVEVVRGEVQIGKELNDFQQMLKDWFYTCYAIGTLIFFGLHVCVYVIVDYYRRDALDDFGEPCFDPSDDLDDVDFQDIGEFESIRGDDEDDDTHNYNTDGVNNNSSRTNINESNLDNNLSNNTRQDEEPDDNSDDEYYYAGDDDSENWEDLNAEANEEMGNSSDGEDNHTSDDDSRVWGDMNAEVNDMYGYQHEGEEPVISTAPVYVDDDRNVLARDLTREIGPPWHQSINIVNSNSRSARNTARTRNQGIIQGDNSLDKFDEKLLPSSFSIGTLKFKSDKMKQHKSKRTRLANATGPLYAAANEECSEYPFFDYIGHQAPQQIPSWIQAVPGDQANHQADLVDMTAKETSSPKVSSAVTQNDGACTDTSPYADSCGTISNGNPETGVYSPTSIALLHSASRSGGLQIAEVDTPPETNVECKLPTYEGDTAERNKILSRKELWSVRGSVGNARNTVPHELQCERKPAAPLTVTEPAHYQKDVLLKSKPSIQPKPSSTSYDDSESITSSLGSWEDLSVATTKVGASAKWISLDSDDTISNAETNLDTTAPQVPVGTAVSYKSSTTVSSSNPPDEDEHLLRDMGHLHEAQIVDSFLQDLINPFVR